VATDEALWGGYSRSGVECAKARLTFKVLTVPLDVFLNSTAGGAQSSIV
jgi:hypothetical protein